MSTIAQWYHNRFSRRERAGFFSAVMMFGVGWMVFAEPTGWSRDDALPHLAIPVMIRVGLWWGSALIATLLLLSKRTNWAAWPFLLAMPAERAASNAYSAYTFIISGGNRGTYQSFGEFFLFGGAAALALVYVFPGKKELPPGTETGQ